MSGRAPIPLDGRATLPRLLRHWAETRGEYIAFREKKFGVWNRYSWRHYYETARRFAMGLKALGFRERDRLAIASEDTPEWMYADLAGQAMRGMVVGIYPTNPWPELHYILRHSNTRIVVCGDQEQVDKVLDAMSKHPDGLPELVRIVCVDMKGLRHYDRGMILSFAEVLALGDEYIARSVAHAGEFEAAVEATAPDDVSILIYTSGTTGPPKGAQLSHRNLLVTACDMVRQFGFNADNYSVVCYLPLCHAAERSYSTVLPLVTGGVVNFAESVDTIAVNLREIAPSVFLGVPRIWEKLQQNILMKMKDSSRFQQKVFAWCMAWGKNLLERRVAAGGRDSLAMRLEFFFLWLVLFRDLQVYMGLDRMQHGFCGGASVSPEVVKFFRILGLRVYQVFGQTESGAVIFYQRPGADSIGASGTPIAGLEYRQTPDGELLVKHDAVFHGYLHDTAATAGTVVDGWLHTGDIVEFTPSGEIKIVDRKKAIIITSGGKNISPSEIENALKDSLYIREAIVIGEGRHFLGALIQIDYETVGKWAQARGLAYTTYRSLAMLDEVRELVGAEVRRVNNLFARVENIRKFVILEKELDHDDGELTATQKVRRGTIEKKFAKEIMAIYGEKA